MTFDQIVAAVFDREGDVYAEPPQIDQPTGRGGITLQTLQDYVRLTGVALLPPTLETLKALTHEQAAKIVAWKLQTFLRTSGLNHIADLPLRMFMLDFAYNSGQERAIRWLQRVVDVPRTGKMDAETIAAVMFPAVKRLPVFLLLGLIAARAQMVTSGVDSHTIAESFEHGLERRIASFSPLQVP